MRPFPSANIQVVCGFAGLAAAVVGFGDACAAQPGGDGLTQPAAYHGPYLTWAGKTSPPERQTDVAPASAAAPASEFAGWPAPAPGAPRLRALAPAGYVAPHVNAPKPVAVAADVAAPASRRRLPRPAQMALSAPPVAAAPAQPPAQTLAQNDTAAAASAANPLGQTGVHYYSLHREYGLTPDQVETPKDRPMVLIGPPDTQSAQKPDDADDMSGADKRGGAEGADE